VSVLSAGAESVRSQATVFLIILFARRMKKTTLPQSFFKLQCVSLNNADFQLSTSIYLVRKVYIVRGRPILRVTVTLKNKFILDCYHFCTVNCIVTMLEIPPSITSPVKSQS